ncbi:uncharacterized protein B0P05DRAFT_527171 [Gilbertella persicaria]|uniref:uncharacterized protein n=1 Tax=Gilbertella persicaria TaxID=101096 RepID=UPI0022208DD0|nr:uncharacterized protein B0P05DRAFT_527171 [Gilbertella persicaria]KAI8091366.1 hypothetical protein B0P05DRAFT_527171 [Gilbertella persicaria]
MTVKLPEPRNTEHYKRILFQFTEELSSKNVFLRLPDSFTPLERMLLQATGNLQRILSAYYNVPSQVKIIKNETVPSADTPYMQFERKIVMYFGNKLAYEADSILTVKDSAVLELIEKHKYGLGQIFGHTHRSPDFVLHAVGRHGNAPGASFWRDYSLTVPDVLDCFIRETFVEGLFDKYDGDKNDGVIWYDTN